MARSLPPLPLLALAAGAFGIGVTEFVIMGLLLEVGADLDVSTASAGLLISGYALGVVVGAPLLTAATARWRRKRVLLSLMAIFIAGNAACALAPTYGLLMAARVVTALARRPVLLGLLTTVLGYAGVFAVFTYVAPLLTVRAGFSPEAISPILLLFGGGLVLGNLVGGRLADRALRPAVFTTLAGLLAVTLFFAPLLSFKAGALVAVALLGFAAFATVAPLQLWVMSRAGDAGESLAASVNIAAFNLGNALGAWAGGATLTALGLNAVPWVAALFPLAALGVAPLSFIQQRKDAIA